MGEGAVRVAHVMHGLMMGGLEQVAVRLCVAAREFNVESRVIAFGADGAVRELLGDLGIPLTYLGSNVKGMSPQALHGIARALRENSVDVAHAHDIGPWLNVVAARTMAPWVRPVVTFHQVAAPGGLERGAAMAAAWASDALVACGNEVLTCVKGWAPPGARVELIGNGVPLGAPPSAEQRQDARRKMGVPDDALVLGYLGRLHEEKGVDLLVDAFLDGVAAQRPNVHLVLIGKGHLEAELRERVARAGCQRVHFLGEIVSASALLAGMDIYVQPSRREGRSLSMLEAMAAGLPTVAQGLPAICEIHQDGGTALLVRPEPRPAFASAITRLIDDAALRKTLGDRAREHVRAWSVEAMAESYAGLYRELTSRRRWSMFGRRALTKEAA